MEHHEHKLSKKLYICNCECSLCTEEDDIGNIRCICKDCNASACGLHEWIDVLQLKRDVKDIIEYELQPTTTTTVFLSVDDVIGTPGQRGFGVILPWGVIGMDELPEHYPIDVDINGNGPAENDQCYETVCWCGVRECTKYINQLPLNERE
jgi:hypothetical protein